MRLLIFMLLSLLAWQPTKAQAGGNYSLVINGDTVRLSLDQPQVYKNKKGETLQLTLLKNLIQHYEDSLLSYDYAGDLTVSKEKIDADIEQVMMMTASGNGIILQKYFSMNPMIAQGLILNQLIEDDVKAGYRKEITSIEKDLEGGKYHLSGKKAVLKRDDDVEEFYVYSYGKQNKGIIIVLMKNDFESGQFEKMTDLFWKSFKLKM